MIYDDQPQMLEAAMATGETYSGYDGEKLAAAFAAIDREALIEAGCKGLDDSRGGEGMDRVYQREAVEQILVAAGIIPPA